jgi:hypothetical protein
MVTKNLFQRLADKRQQSPTGERKNLPRDELADGQRLLDFLQRWTGDTICLRDILVYGPYALRNNRVSAVAATKILTEHGWLSELEAHRPDRKVWRINRKPIIRPKITQTTAARV